MKKAIFILIPVLILFSSQASVFAEEITTQSTDYLRLESSSVVDGDETISITPIIQLDFAKNMDDITVLNNNKDAFYLLDENGNTVPIKIVFPDTQMQDYLKKQVFIIPKASLEPNKNYLLIVDKSLISRDGLELEKTIKINFTTSTSKNSTSTNDNKALEMLNDNILEYDGNLEYTETAIEIPSSNTEIGEKNSVSTNVIALVTAGIIFAIIIVAISFTLIKKKESNTQE